LDHLGPPYWETNFKIRSSFVAARIRIPTSGKVFLSTSLTVLRNCKVATCYLFLESNHFVRGTLWTLSTFQTLWQYESTPIRMRSDRCSTTRDMWLCGGFHYWSIIQFDWKCSLNHDKKPPPPFFWPFKLQAESTMGAYSEAVKKYSGVSASAHLGGKVGCPSWHFGMTHSAELRFTTALSKNFTVLGNWNENRLVPYGEEGFPVSCMITWNLLFNSRVNKCVWHYYRLRKYGFSLTKVNIWKNLS